MYIQFSFPLRERDRQAHKKELEKKYVEEFKLAREEWKKVEKQRLEEENRRIAEFAKLQEQREGERQASKKEQEAYREQLLKDVSRKCHCHMMIAFIHIIKWNFLNSFRFEIVTVFNKCYCSVVQLSDKIEEQRRLMDEMEQVRLELYQEEKEEEDRQREKALREKQQRQMEELQRTHQEQLYLKKLRQEAEKAEEEEFRNGVKSLCLFSHF